MELRKGRRMIRALIAAGKPEIADRVLELWKIAREESDTDPINANSLYRMIVFFTKYDIPLRPHGDLSVDHNGIMGAGWMMPLVREPTKHWRQGSGILSLRFLDNAKILFAGETDRIGQHEPFCDFGEDTPDSVFERIKPFFHLLDQRDEFTSHETRIRHLENCLFTLQKAIEHIQERLRPQSELDLITEINPPEHGD